jgi:thiol:disulfide interchange protein DsbA
MYQYAFVLLAALAAPAALAQGLLEKYQAGTHYFPIQPAQATTAPKGKVEVVEVFSYACIHCATFQSKVNDWTKSMPASASFGYLPAAWNPSWEMVARAYYASEALGILDQTHNAFFNAIFIEKIPFATLQDIASWYTRFGVTEQAFLDAANSFTTNTRIQRSKQMVPRYGVDGTPSVVVAGKYRVTGGSAGGYDKVFDVVDFLVAREAAAAP